jgi:DNA-binding response OmpR family regulator
MSYKVAIHTQDKALAAQLSDGLVKHGFDVLRTSSKRKILDQVAAGRIHFAVLDGASAKEDVLRLCHELRRASPELHIVLAVDRAMRSVDVDGYITQPITMRKLLHRIRVLLTDDARNVIVVGDVQLDPRNRTVCCAGRVERLTPKEARLLRLLMERCGSVVSRKEIMNLVWDTEYLGDTRTVDVHIRWLRKKIEPAPSHPTHISTVRRQGYRFDVCWEAQEDEPAAEPAG